MDFISLPALLGTIAGVIVGAVNYAFFAGIVERSLRAHDTSQNAAERETFESKISLMRRLVLGFDVLLFGAIGYWFGKTVGG